MTNRCRSCQECTEKLNAMKFLTVYLDEDIKTETGECILIEVSGMRFDCKTHTIEGDGTGTGINVVGTPGRGYSDNEIQNCVVKNFEKGIRVSDIKNAKIRKNTLTENKEGLYLVNAEYSTIEENEVRENENYGIDLLSSIRNEIKDSIISSNAGGIYIQQGSSKNKINSNTIQSNNYGVYIKDSDSNELNNNEIIWNTLYGVYLQNAVIEMEENTICYNGKDITGEFYNESVGRKNKCGSDSDWNDKTTSGCKYSC